MIPIWLSALISIGSAATGALLVLVYLGTRSTAPRAYEGLRDEADADAFVGELAVTRSPLLMAGEIRGGSGAAYQPRHARPYATTQTLIGPVRSAADTAVLALFDDLVDGTQWTLPQVLTPIGGARCESS